VVLDVAELLEHAAQSTRSRAAQLMRAEGSQRAAVVLRAAAEQLPTAWRLELEEQLAVQQSAEQRHESESKSLPLAA
jgi:hypothetical protein